MPRKISYFYINSPGGSVYDALAIYDTMQYVTNDIQTVGIGVQASAAAFLLSCGTKGKRFVLPNSTVMIHQPSSGTRGKVTDQEIDLRESLRIKKLLEEIMAKNTGQKAGQDPRRHGTRQVADRRRSQEIRHHRRRHHHTTQVLKSLSLDI